MGAVLARLGLEGGSTVFETEEESTGILEVLVKLHLACC